MFLGGVLSQRLGVKVCCLIGGGIIVLGTFLASRSETISSMIIAQGMLFGIGMGLCYTAPISAAVKWLPQHKGLVTGIIVGGFGCGAFVFGIIATSIVNPRHESVNTSGPDKNYYSPDSEVVGNVPAMYEALTIVYAVFLLAGIYCVFDPSPQDMQKQDLEMLEMTQDDNQNHVLSRHKRSLASKSYQSVEDLAESNPSQSTTNPAQSSPFGDHVAFTPQQLLATPLAYHVASCLITTTVGGMYLAGTFKTYGQQSLHNEAFLAAISSFAAIFNATGRIFWGAVADYIGPLVTIQIMSLLFALTIFTYPLSLSLGQYGFALWTFAIFFFEGANFVLYVALSVALFGTTYSASNYGLIFSSYSGFVVLNIFVLAHAKVSFSTAAMAMGVLTLCGCGNACLLQWHIRYLANKYSNDNSNTNNGIGECKVY